MFQLQHLAPKGGNGGCGLERHSDSRTECAVDMRDGGRGLVYSEAGAIWGAAWFCFASCDVGSSNARRGAYFPSVWAPPCLNWGK
jgi:hypothetical protein